MAETKKTQAAAKPETPRYIIRQTVFLNHRYVMASESSPVVIETVTRPNVNWEPANDAARVQLEKHMERVQKVIKEGEVGTSAHEAVRTIKRTLAKYDGVPPEDDPSEDIEPQDAAFAGVVVTQPKDAVAVLRASSSQGLQIDRSGAQVKSQPLTGEPPEDQPQAGTEEPSSEEPTPEQQAEEERVENEQALTEESDTLSAAQKKTNARKK